jgi:TolA-binding protein
MAPEKRITKRQMKEDVWVSSTFKATEYVKQNQKLFTIAVSVVVVILVAITLFRWNGAKKKDTASSLLAQAEIMAAMGDMNQYVTDLQQLSDNYSGTPGGKIATLRLANTAFDQKMYDKAQQYFETILSRYSSDKMMAAGAAAGVAACREYKADYAAAAKSYKQAAGYADDTSAPGFLLKAGIDFAKVGNKQSAKEMLNQIEKKYPNAAELSAAKRTLAELEY